MENPIKDNRIISNPTFAIRLLHFIERIKVNDPASEEEKQMIINITEQLIRYQCKTVTDNDEINYLKRINIFEKYTKPFYVTEDNIELFENQDIILFSCMKKVTTGEQVLYHNNKHFDNVNKKYNPNRVYFVDKQKCFEYIEMNKPKYSEKQVKEWLEGINQKNQLYSVREINN